MKAKELRELTVEELQRKATEMRENLFDLKIRRQVGDSSPRAPTSARTSATSLACSPS